MWEWVLPIALSSIRSLLSTATNEVPHDRMFRFSRMSLSHQKLPDFLLRKGSAILHRRHITRKGDSPTEYVSLVETLSPYFARVAFSDGRIDTVSTRDLAPSNKQPTCQGESQTERKRNS